MAILEERIPELQPTTIDRMPALRALSFLKHFRIPEIEDRIPQTSSPDEVFSNDVPVEEMAEAFQPYSLGGFFAAIVEEHGSTSLQSPHYKQLSGVGRDEKFLATLYPAHKDKDTGQQLTSAGFHVVIEKNAPFNSNTYTIPMTISLDSGIPLVKLNKRGAYGRLEFGEQMGAAQAMVKVRHLAELMHAALKGEESSPGHFTY